MPPDTISDPNNPIISRELYDHIVRGATLPVVLLLIWMGWIGINHMMDPKRRQDAQNRRIRKAVAARQAHRDARDLAAQDKPPPRP